MPDWFDMDDPGHREQAAIGVAVLSAAAVLGGTLWLVRRQLTAGDVVQVKVVHAPDPALNKQITDVRDLLAAYLPPLKKLADQGMDLNVKMPTRHSPG